LAARAVAEFQELDPPAQEADALTELGIVQSMAGDVAAARKALTGAIEIFKQLDDRSGEARATCMLGELGVRLAATNKGR
jgi:hypothetical protein